MFGGIVKSLFVGLCATAILAGCASTNVPAPVFDRSPAPAVTARKPAAAPVTPKVVVPVNSAAEIKSAAPAPKPADVEAPPPPSVARPTQPQIRPYREGDWRPEYHTVQKGDTLYSIALDYGQDYRDLAAWNRLADPSYIQIDQKLRLFPLGASAESVSLEPVELPPASLAVQSATPAPAPAPAPRTIPVFNEPKASKVAYSEQALARLLGAPPVTVPPVAVVPTPPPPVVAKPAVTNSPKSVQVGIAGMPDERLNWEWPVVGKITYDFGKGINQKGVGLDGKMGQAVVASAPGKVVYSGSGLRGYGKLIIIKHNPTYLSVYAHNSQLLVKEGQAVAQGQKIAEIGDTDSDRVGLHFEIRRLGKPTDPLKYLPEKPS